MAFAIVHRFDGGTKEQYEAALAKVHPSDGSLPEGQTHHIAGATDDGWIIVALFDSEASWERFRDQTLMPGMEQMGDEGFAGPPQQTSFEVHNMQVA
ncbi:MAG: hypothetical protein ABSB24_05665 [Gaiellaceae bacterium]|jgi:hypothetical protein